MKAGENRVEMKVRNLKKMRKQRRQFRIAVGAYLFVVLLSLTACGAEKSHEESDNILQPEKSVVQIRAGEVTGSGVLWGAIEDGEKLAVLTAAHVLEELLPQEMTEGETMTEVSYGEMPTVVFADGTERVCDNFLCSETVDAAVLLISDKNLAKKPGQENDFATVDKKRFDALRDGDNCIAIGSGTGEERAVCTGEVLDHWIYMEDYAQYMIWADVEIHSGMSGGGLFDADGYFMGILSGGSEDGQLAAVPLSLILSEFNAYLD